jgi:hypothetical protein
MLRLALACAALAGLAAVPTAASAAEPVAACHCFRERTWNPEKPAAADPYILATTRSSLLSAAFGPPKAELVSAAMGGRAAEDLWVAHWAGTRLGRPAADLLSARDRTGGWAAALAGAKGLGASFDAALAAGGDARALAALAVEDVLRARLGAGPRDLQALRSAGASIEELVLASVLARHLGVPTAPLVREVRAGRTTWGAVLDGAGLAPKAMDGIVRGLVR